MPGASVSHSTRHTKVEEGLEGLQKRLDAARASGQPFVKIGLPAGSSPYPDGTSVLLVGAVQEFGTDDGVIPERSWLRAGMAENSAKHQKLLADVARGVLRGDRSTRAGLEIVGTTAAADVAKYLRALKEPPNAQSTIDSKGSSNPLVDTAHLHGSITHEVEA